MPLNLDSLRIEIQIDAPQEHIWDDIANLKTHVEWMEDALEISFLGSKRQGVGTFFKCVTKFWKFKFDDQIMVTEWNVNQRMSIQHDGFISGNGFFKLLPNDNGTTFVWEEHLLFPVYLGGPFGEYFSRPFLKRTWTANLANLKDRIEKTRDVNPIAFFTERGIELQTSQHKDGAWHVSLSAPKIKDFKVENYAQASTGFSARVAAMQRWIAEEEPHL